MPWPLRKLTGGVRLAACVVLLGMTMVGMGAEVAAYTPGLNQLLGPDITCMAHRLAYEKAAALLPRLLPPGSLRRRQVWDSLVTGEMTDGVGDCNGTTAAPPPDCAGSARPTPPAFAGGAAAGSVFVDYAGGDDASRGTIGSPVKTVARGLELARILPKAAATFLVLRAGLHHLAAPLALGPADSGLTIQNQPGEEVWLSGAVPVEPHSWEPHGRQEHGVWKTKLPVGSRSSSSSSSGGGGSSTRSGGGGKTGKVWGLHELHDPADLSLWQVVKTLARYPNAGCRDGREHHWAEIGPAATWQSRQPLGAPAAHQIVVNATAAVPKTVTNFPDYYVYGVGGSCAAQGYDPPGGWMCSEYGSMHGGTFDSATAKWEGGGYPVVFPGALSMSNTTGVAQSVFPNSSAWVVNGSNKGILRAWINGWFVNMWEVAAWVSRFLFKSWTFSLPFCTCLSVFDTEP